MEILNGSSGRIYASTLKRDMHSSMVHLEVPLTHNDMVAPAAEASDSAGPDDPPLIETLGGKTSSRSHQKTEDAPRGSLDDVIRSRTKLNNNDDMASQRVDRIMEMLRGVEEKDASLARRNLAATPQSPPPAQQLTADPTPGIYRSVSLPQSTSIPISKNDPSVNVFDGVKAKIMGQQMEIEEKAKSIALLKDEIKKLKESHEEHLTELKKDSKAKLTAQRKEFEVVIKRHLSFVDKLLAEKDDLSKKCDVLTEEVKNMEKAFKEKLKSVEEQHVKDVKQQRELWQAAEKIKRDKWIAEKTKSIKDQTVKGLEPEIQRMLSQHKHQIRQIEDRAKEELIRERNMLAEATQRQIESLRDKMIAERQRACEEEREYARQRYQKQLERDEIEFQQQKRKLLAEFEEQKHLLSEETKRQRHSESLEHKKSLDEARSTLEKVQSEHAHAMNDLRKGHVKELALLRERLAVEKEQWQEQYMAKQEADMKLRDKQLKEKLIKERDAELEVIIERLESETNSNASDIHRRFRLDFERMKAEAAEEMKQLRDQHSLALDKVISLQAAKDKCEEEKRGLQKQILQAQHEAQSKETFIQAQKTELLRLKVDEKTLADTIRAEFEEQLLSKDSEISELNKHISTLTQRMDSVEKRYKDELNERMVEKDTELNMLEDRVRHALSIKDEIIGSLESQLEEATIRNNTLTHLIEKQRTELLG